MKYRVLAFVLALACLLAPATSNASSLSRQIDAVFQNIDSASEPGCAVGVIHKGRYVHKAGYGLANLEHQVPISAASVFRIGSVSKQFTAMAIALLAEHGHLDLDADIHTYLPELRDYGQPVTVRQMVHHVAGLGDYDHPALRKPDGGQFRFGNEDYWTIEEFYERVTQADLLHPPGQHFAYSNLGYFLLSQVVERVSGLTLRQYAAREIFGPLQMSASHFNDAVNQVVPNRADGYHRLDDGDYEIYMTNLNWVGDGGVYTNLDDFIRWDQNFYENRLGKGGPELIQVTTTPLENAYEVTDQLLSPIAYAFGLEVENVNGEALIGHGGTWVGFTALYHRYPKLKLSVVVFCNSTHLSAYDLGDEVGALAVKALRSGAGLHPRASTGVVE